MRKKLMLVLVIIMAFSCITLTPFSAQANVGSTTKKAVFLKDNVVYKKYDITGNGRVDDIKVNYKTYVNSKSGCGEATIYVKGKKIKTFSGGAAADVYLVAPKKKLTYLIVDYHYKGGGDEAYAYRYVKGKLKKAHSANLYAPLTYGSISKVTKSTVSVNICSGKYERCLFKDYWGDNLQFTAVYKIKNKKLVLTSSEFKAVPISTSYSDEPNTYTANRGFRLSSNPLYQDYDGPYISEGDSINILALHRVHGDEGCYNFSIKMSINGIIGWLTPAIQKEYFDDETPFLRVE